MKKRKEDLRILFVDDNEINLSIIGKMFENKGLKPPTLASNGLEAIQLVEKNDFDIIFIDICMPTISGLDVSVKIKSMPDKKEIPIIAISAMSMSQASHDCEEAGTDGFISLPATIFDYMEKIQQHVEISD